MSQGVGAFKFQKAIKNEIKIIQDPKHKSRIKSQSRKSIQEKCKQQLQKSKLNSRRNHNDFDEKQNCETEQNQEELQESVLDEISIFENKKQEKQNFILQVSEPSSSDCSYSDIDIENLPDNKNNYNSQQEKIKKSLLSQKVNNLIIKQNNIQQIPSSYQQINKIPSITPTKQKTQNFFKPQILKKEILLLRSLKQNQELNVQSNIVEEYKQEKEICIDFDCQDIQTFLRLQNEFDEMKRKQMDFQIQKERHSDLINNKKLNKNSTINEIKPEENKLLTVLMAKKFIKNMKLKKETDDRSPQTNHLQKKMRATQIK